LSNTGGGGRGGDVGEIIGTVINHGKKKYWGRGLGTGPVPGALMHGTHPSNV